MYGITNNIEQRYKLSVVQYDNLIYWLDGTDFLNHSSKTDVTVTNTNNYYTITDTTINGVNTQAYVKAGASSNGLEIAPTSYITVGAAFTEMAWGQKLANANYMNLFTYGRASAPIIELRLRNGSDTLIRFYYLNGTSSTTADITVNAALNTWHHYAISYTPGSYKIFYDGNLVQTFNVTTSSNNVNMCRLLGTTAYTSDTGGASMATDFRYYNVCLSDNEIADIYNTGPLQHR